MSWRQIWQVVMWFGDLPVAAPQVRYHRAAPGVDRWRPSGPLCPRRDPRGCMHPLQLTPVPLSPFRLSQLATVFPLERGVIDLECDAWFCRANCLYFAPDPLCCANTHPHACKPRGGMIFNATHDFAGRGSFCNSPPCLSLGRLTYLKTDFPKERGVIDFSCR